MLSRRRVLVLSGVLTGVLALAGCADEQPDTADLDRWLRRYVDLLNANELSDLSEHLGRPGGDAQERLARFGGRGLSLDQVDITREVPRVYRATMVARTRDGLSVPMTEVVEWEDGRWHMGPLTAPPPSSPAAATESPTGR